MINKQNKLKLWKIWQIIKFTSQIINYYLLKLIIMYKIWLNINNGDHDKSANLFFSK